MSLSGKVALVTGASRGIGADLARHLAEAGASVAVAARTEREGDPRLPGTIHSVVDGIKSDGHRALAVRMDLRQPESISDGVKQAVDRLGRLDIVVNNAAVLVPGAIETVREKHLDLLWQINLRGPLLLLRNAIPHLRATDGGRVLNISSVAAKFPGPGPYPEAGKGGAFYGMLKSALDRYTQGLAMELQEDRIAVNALSPEGRIRTPGNLFAENDPENPTLEFESADLMGKAAVWICQQGPSFTGNILFDVDVCREQNL
jgi:NAD(P)-dependent dehydrogenase (short-subunit alcohol dehydrogenase family)